MRQRLWTNLTKGHSGIPGSTLDARGLLARQRQGTSEQVVLVGERPLAQAVKSNRVAIYFS